MRVIGDASTLEFAAFKGHFLRDRCFSVIPKLLDNAAGRTDRDNGNIRPIVAPTNGGPRPTRIIVVMLAPHLGVRRATVIPALSPCPSGDVEFYLVTRGKVKATREKRHDKNVCPVPRVIERTEVTCATRVRRYGNLQILFDGKVRSSASGQVYRGGSIFRICEMLSREINEININVNNTGGCLDCLSRFAT